MGYNSDMQNGEFDFDEFVERWREDLKKAWEALPKGTRQDLTNALGYLPTELKGWQALIDQAIDHLRVAAGSKHQVAILGPVNVGKSTLYNQFIRTKADRARVSAVPGTTRFANEADAGIFNVIDTPGADSPGVVGAAEKASALNAAQEADVIVLLLDATHGILAPEQALFREIMDLGKPTIVALNKMDLVSKDRPQVIGSAAGNLGIPSESIIAISAKKGIGLEKILIAIAKSEPGIIAALGAALPEYRWNLAQRSISKAASTAAAIAVTPLPFLDFFPLLGIQVALVLSIARIFAYKITLPRARELVATFGMAVVGRSIFYEMSKLSGPPGWLIAAGVAAGTTSALGYAASIWFERGEKISREMMGQIAKGISRATIDRLKSLGKRKPKGSTLRESVRQIIEESSAEAALKETREQQEGRSTINE